MIFPVLGCNGRTILIFFEIIENADKILYNMNKIQKIRIYKPFDFENDFKVCTKIIW